MTKMWTPEQIIALKDPAQDRFVWLEYLETAAKERKGWKELYRACRDVVE